jgi:hypothetical protein
VPASRLRRNLRQTVVGRMLGFMGTLPAEVLRHYMRVHVAQDLGARPGAFGFLFHGRPHIGDGLIEPAEEVGNTSGHGLKGFEIKFTSERFDAYMCELHNPERARPLRQREYGEWFLYRREGILDGIPETLSCSAEKTTCHADRLGRSTSFTSKAN